MRVIFLTAAVLWALSGAAVLADGPECGQGLVEQALGAMLPETTSLRFIEPTVAVQIIYQWNANNGYCGEASLVSAGMANGQYMSQADARLVCGAFMGKATDGTGASLLQSGEMGAESLNSNAQMLLQDVDAGMSGTNDFAHASQCAVNSGLDAVTYPFASGDKTANVGNSGVQDYLSWIKAEMIAGHHVTIGVLANGGEDAEYDHEVTVLKIGTNHAVTDDTYYADDVLYFDDHGEYTLQRNSDGVWDFADNPAVPVGAGGDVTGCTPYVFAYPFGRIAKTRKEANEAGAPAYSLVIPSSDHISVIAGNTAPEGDGMTQVIGPHNYALSVRRPLDPAGKTEKVSLTIASSRSLEDGVWAENAKDAIAGFNYESPYISPMPDGCDDGDCFTNMRPAPMQITLIATVQGLVAGQDYTLLEYVFPALNGSKTGTLAAIPVPVQDFGLQAHEATNVTRFTAKSTRFSLPPIQRMSNQIIMFRAVKN